MTVTPTSSAPKPTDTSALDALLTRWRDHGDTAARDDLFRLSQERVAAIVRGRLNEFQSLRDDSGVVTDQVLNLVTDRYWAWSEGDGFALPKTIRAYFDAMATICGRVLLDFRRTSQRPGGKVADPDVGVERAVSDPLPDDRIDLVLPEIERLPHEQRESLRLHYFCGLEMKQVADVMGITYQQAYRLVNYALAQIGGALRGRVHPDNFDSSAADA